MHIHLIRLKTVLFTPCLNHVYIHFLFVMAHTNEFQVATPEVTPVSKKRPEPPTSAEALATSGPESKKPKLVEPTAVPSETPQDDAMLAEISLGNGGEHLPKDSKPVPVLLGHMTRRQARFLKVKSVTVV